MFKRNQIVHTAGFREGREPEFVMFGRIVKKIDDNHYLVVSNGKNYEILPISHIKDPRETIGKEYKGYWSTANSFYPDWKQDKFSNLPTHSVFEPLPKLRKMKQNSAYYTLVWRKQKKTRHQLYMEKYCEA